MKHASTYYQYPLFFCTIQIQSFVNSCHRSMEKNEHVITIAIMAGLFGGLDDGLMDYYASP